MLSDAVIAKLRALLASPESEPEARTLLDELLRAESQRALDLVVEAGIDAPTPELREALFRVAQRIREGAQPEYRPLPGKEH